jgi:hypothetical protein
MRASVPGRAAATATLATPIGSASRSFKVSSVELIPDADITGVATNSTTWELRNRGPDGGLNVLLASLALTAGVNASRRFAKAVTLITTNGTPTVAEGDQLEWHSVKVGAGLLDPAGTVVIGESPI